MHETIKLTKRHPQPKFWYLLTLDYLSKVVNQYSFNVCCGVFLVWFGLFFLHLVPRVCRCENNGPINKLHAILYIRFLAGQEGCRGKMSAILATQDTVHLCIKCMF